MHQPPCPTALHHQAQVLRPADTESCALLTTPLLLTVPSADLCASPPLHNCSCIIDREPRVFDAESCALLANMTEMVVREVEKEMLLDMQVRGVEGCRGVHC